MFVFFLFSSFYEFYYRKFYFYLLFKKKKSSRKLSERVRTKFSDERLVKKKIKNTVRTNYAR